MDLDEAAELLYAVTPETFVATRTRLAAQAKDDGDAAAAAAIRRLARPSQPAWQVNLLRRDRPALPDELAALAATLRAAAEAGDPAGVRRADAERRRLLAELADRAGALAEQSGRPTTAAVRREVEATLQAALTSPEAAEAVASGRLTASLFDSGLDALGLLSLAPAPPRTAPASPPARSAAQEGRGASSAGGQDKGRAQAAEALQQAQAALRAAKAEAARTRSHADQLAEEVSQLSARLEAVRRRAEAAVREAEEADRAEQAATAEHERARAALERLGPG